MVQIRFMTPEGSRIDIDCEPGVTLMEAAKANDVPGIDADCGGSMVCGTCHVIVATEWKDKLPEQDAMESELLQYVPEPLPNTRLTCQIPVTRDLDGIILQLPRLQR